MTQPFTRTTAANLPYKLPPPLWNARCKACWFSAGLLVLVGLSFWSLDMQWAQFFSREAAASMARFVGEFFPPDLSPVFLRKVALGTAETLAMSLLGTLLAVVAGLALALPASRTHGAQSLWLRAPTRTVLNALRSIPELVWAALLLISAGLGPTSGVLAIALTYGGMLGKVYSEILESGEPQATQTLLRNGSGRLQAFFYALLPGSSAELVSYTVYRWECAIRSSVVLGFVGAGGLGQQLDNSMKMFNGGEVATLLLVFMALVALADRVSAWLRKGLA